MLMLQRYLLYAPPMRVLTFSPPPRRPPLRFFRQLSRHATPMPPISRRYAVTLRLFQPR